VINKVAWNSAATNASDVSDPTTVPQPAEPPKVGIVASNVPTLSSQTSLVESQPNVDLTDAVTVAGTGGQPGSLTWNLVGPVAPVGGTCAAVTWTGAAVFASGTTAVPGDGTVTTGPATPTAAGCYGWTDSLSSTTSGAFPSPVVASAGVVNEVTLVSLYQPMIVTASTAAAVSGGTDFSDAVTVSDSGIGVSPASPPSAELTWTLIGPIAAIHGKCTAVAWSAAPQVATGTITVTGDGTYSTPTTGISKQGCYTFFESLAATPDSAKAFTLPGDPLETVQLSRDGTPVLAFTGIDIVDGMWFALGLVMLGLMFVATWILRRRRRA
jgi:hypothetical protein